MYDTKSEALESKTRWDYSFGLDNMNVVILIRHITVIDKSYGEVRSMPEFCYDYDTFVKLGGWIEHTTRIENVVNMKSPPPCGDITPMEVVSNSRAEPQS